MKKIILLITILVLTSCAPIKQSKLTTETSFNNKSENGLVIGTVTFVHPKKKSPYDKYRFHLTYENDNLEDVKANSSYFTVNVNQINGRFNGELNDSKTYPIVLEQKPGNYTFDGFWFFWNGGLVTNEFKNPVNFNLPFVVEKAKITYIGNIIVNVKSTINPYIEITNELNNNLSYFKNKYPNIDWNLVTNQTITSGNNGNGFIKLNK